MPDAVKTTVDFVQPLFTAAGAIAAAAWVLYNFGLTRVSAPQITIEAKLKARVKMDGKTIVVFAIDVKNSGRTRVKKRQALLNVNVVRIPSSTDSPLKIGSAPNYKSDVWEILTTHSSAEPSEIYHEEVAFIVDDRNILQVGVVFIGMKARQTWETNYLFPPEN